MLHGGRPARARLLFLFGFLRRCRASASHVFRCFADGVQDVPGGADRETLVPALVTMNVTVTGTFRLLIPVSPLNTRYRTVLAVARSYKSSGKKNLSEVDTGAGALSDDTPWRPSAC